MSSVRPERALLEPVLNASEAPEGIVVVPEPLCVPPVHVNTPVTVIGLVPVKVLPLDWTSVVVVIGTLLLKVAVPPLSLPWYP